MALTLPQVQDVCYGQAGQKNPWGWYGNPGCRYLTNEMVGKEYKSLCIKHAPGLIEKKQKEGSLPKDLSKLPDNCPGYKYMKYIDQGYDV